MTPKIELTATKLNWNQLSNRIELAIYSDGIEMLLEATNGHLVVIMAFHLSPIKISTWYTLMLSTDQKETLEERFDLKQTSLYQEHMAERDEILKHKWLESEKAGQVDRNENGKFVEVEG